ELGSLSAREVVSAEQDGGFEVPNPLDRLWLQGRFPLSYLCAEAGDSLQWRLDFIQAYLERDLPQLGLNVATEQLARFWRMLANDQGELFNAERFARSLGVSGHTVKRYLDILDKLLLVRILEPWYTNTGKRLVKSPRPFIR